MKPHFGGFWETVFCDGDGNQKAMATAEGRLCNHSSRLACLPGVSRGIIIYRRRAVVENKEYDFGGWLRLVQQKSVATKMQPRFGYDNEMSQSLNSSL